MRQEIEAFLNSAPTFFDIYDKYRRRDIEVRTFDLPFSLEDLVLECAERNLAVSGLVGATRTGILFIHDTENLHFSIPRTQVLSDGDGLKIYGTEIPGFYTSLNGEPKEIQPSDLEHAYSRAKDEIQGLPLVSLMPGKGFGEFIESYIDHEYHVYTAPDIEMERDFTEGFDDVCLDARLYEQLDRYLKRHGLIKKHKMIKPGALFNQANGNLLVEYWGEDTYFGEYIELVKDEGTNEAIGFMKVQKEESVG